MRTDRSPRRGFTLIEILVALAIGAIAIALAASSLAAAGEATDATRLSARAATARGNGVRLLSRLVGQMAAPTAGDTAIIGIANSARFLSTCDTPAGWQESCRVELFISGDAGCPRELVVRTSAGDSVQVLPGRELATILYLSQGARGARWSTAWSDLTSLPAAIGVASPVDTLILRVGDRG